MWVIVQLKWVWIKCIGFVQNCAKLNCLKFVFCKLYKTDTHPFQNWIFIQTWYCLFFSDKWASFLYQGYFNFNLFKWPCWTDIEYCHMCLALERLVGLEWFVPYSVMLPLSWWVSLFFFLCSTHVMDLALFHIKISQISNAFNDFLTL